MKSLLFRFLLLVVFALIAFNLQLNANPNIVFQKEFSQARLKYEQLLKIDNVGYFFLFSTPVPVKTVASTKQNYFIYQFDENMNYVKHKQMSEQFFDVKITSPVGESNHVITIEFNTKDKLSQLYKNKLNPKSLSFNKPELIAEYKDFDHSLFTPWLSFHTAASSDKSKLLVAYRESYSKGRKTEVRIIVFDNELEIIDNKTITLPIPDELFNLTDIAIGNNGELALLGELYDSEQTTNPYHRSKKLAHKVYYTDEERTELFETPMQLNNALQSYPTMIITDNGRLIVSAIYRHPKTNSSFSDGIFISITNIKTQDVIEKKQIDFSNKFILEGTDKKQRSKLQNTISSGKQISMSRTVVEEIHESADGGFFIFAQMVKTAKKQPDSGPRVYDFDDVMVFRFSKDGELLWQKKIPKRQTEGLIKISGFCCFVHNNSAYVMFNDNPANVEFENPEKIKSAYYKDPQIVLFSFDENGNITRTTLTNKGELTSLVNSTFNKINSNTFVVFAEKTKGVFQPVFINF